MNILNNLMVFGIIGILLILGGCGAPATHDDQAPDLAAQLDFTGRSPILRGDFAGNPAAQKFIERMRKAGFPPEQTAAILSRAHYQDSVIKLMDKQAPAKSVGYNGAWTRYRAKFLNEENIAKGVAFWERNSAALARAENQYGVPPEYILAILGVETHYGSFVGSTKILDALATLAFNYPRRAEYFADELKEFLIMTRDEKIDPRQPKGSFAGAMGLGQFMPSNFHRYAVDFTGDGHRDLWRPADAIGSVANYFKAHGWRRGERVTVRAHFAGSKLRALKTGFDTQYRLAELARYGITPASALGTTDSLSLLELDAQGGLEYWLGLPNFFVITRYNHNTYYAMAVYQLAQALRARRSDLRKTQLSLRVPSALNIQVVNKF